MSALDEAANDSDSSDGVPEIGLDALRPEALAALLSVKQARETAAADATALPDDFGMSQFWYTDACADELAAAVRDRGRVAVVSCPTAHRALCRAGDAASASAATRPMRKSRYFARILDSRSAPDFWHWQGAVRMCSGFQALLRQPFLGL